MDKEYYSTFNICKHLKIDRGRLREWLNFGYVKPTIPAKKQGQAAKFTLFDVYLVDLFRLLLERGFGRKPAGE